MTDSINCLRCGRCCYFFDEKGNLKKCKHLVRGGGKTLCRNFRNRFKKPIYKKGDYLVGCLLRKDSKFDYPGCNFNSGKPMFGGGDKNGV